MVDVEVLKVVVKVDATRTEISTEEGSVSGEYGGDIDVAFPAERYGHTDLPFVEVGDYGLGQLPRDVLHVSGGQAGVSTAPKNEGRDDSLPPGTRRRCSRRQSPRLSHDRWEELGCQRGSKGRPSIRPTWSTGYRCRTR